jgi:hypothetical protein
MYPCISVFMDTLNEHAAPTFTKEARSFSVFIKRLKNPELPRYLDGSRVLHAVELLSPLPFQVHMFK